MGLEEQRDVIEYPIVDDMDINGWDLRKALRLFAKSNPGFVEWIRALALLPQVFSVESGIYHYRSTAKTNFRGYLQTDLVRLKKYFDVLRPLLSAHWQSLQPLQRGTPTPMRSRCPWAWSSEHL